MSHARAGAGLAMALLLASCGSSSKPTEADIAAYLATLQPGLLKFGPIHASIDPAAAPSGAWKITVSYTATAQTGLYRLADGTLAERLAFERTVTAVEGFRAPRITAVEDYAKKLGLMQEGGAMPEPALVATLVAKQGDSLTGTLVLTAAPANGSWNFTPASPIPQGQPLDRIKAAYPHSVVVIQGSAQDVDYHARQDAFLTSLAKVPKP